jgi:hypothetical protein
MPRRLAAADLVIALCLGHEARAILSTPRGADHTGRQLAKAEVPHHIETVRKYQLINSY